MNQDDFVLHQKMLPAPKRRYLCFVCVSTVMERDARVDELLVCDDCKKLQPLEQGVLKNITHNMPSFWFHEVAGFFVEGNIKTRLLAIHSRDYPAQERQEGNK